MQSKAVIAIRAETALAEMPTADLRAELARGLSLTADTLSRLGSVWAELERRGEDLSDLRHGLARTLPLIAAGRLSAEAVVAFAGRPALLRALEGVPLERQRLLASGEAVTVIDPASPHAVQEISLDRLPAAAIRLVFSEGEIRSPEAQRLALRPRRLQPKEEDAARRYRPRYDQAAGTITIGKMTVKLADLLEVLSAAAGPDHPPVADLPETYGVLRVRLTKAEQAKLTALAGQTELPDWELVRKALRAFGLI